MFNEQVKEKVKARYLAGEKTRAIQQRFSLSPGSLYRMLHAQGVQLRGAKTVEPLRGTKVAESPQVEVEEPVMVTTVSVDLYRLVKTVPTYYLEGDQSPVPGSVPGPYATVQEALDALGLPKDKRPHHNRYDRLSAKLKKSIRKGKG